MMRFVVLYCTIFLSVILSACFEQQPVNDVSNPDALLNHSPELFEQRIKKPYWFYVIPSDSLSTSEEVSKLWQSEKRYGDDLSFHINSKIFYKSCYKAIVAHYDDEELVVKCLWLMDLDLEKPERMAIGMYVVNHFSDHRQRVDNCANCMPADSVARVTQELARDEKHDDPQLAIARLEKLLDTRLNEISHWLQVELYVSLGQHYLDAGVTDAQAQRFKAAYERFNILKETDEPVRSRFDELVPLYDALLSARYQAKQGEDKQ